jgi:broad specificity phosphatase PhoE
MNFEKIIVVIRHGERADLAGDEVKLNLSDPELTETGRSQAYDTGYRLKEILDEIFCSQPEIAILSSPFARTLETAKFVKNGLGYNLPIIIENGLSEFITKSWFKSNPKEFLSYENKNELLIKELMNEIIIDNSLSNLPEFPESTNKCIERFNNTLELIVYNYLIKKGFDVVILITHVYGMHILCQKMNIPFDLFDIEYCSTFIFKYNMNSNKFTFEKNFYPISN